MVTATDDRSDRLASLESDVRNINNRLDLIQDDIREMRVEHQAEMRQMRAEHQADMRQVNARFDQVNGRFDQVNERFDQVHGRIDGIQQTMMANHAEIQQTIMDKQDETHGRIDRLFWAIIGVGGGIIAALIVLILRIGPPAG